MQGRISNIVPLFLITILSIVAVEALYQALEFFVFKPTTVSKTVINAKDTVTPPQQTTNVKKLDYRIILKRNLFSRPGEESVDPAEEPVEQTTAANSSELGIVLMGTVSGTDNSRRAFILNKQTREQELFSTGEVVEGALIKEILRGKLVLSINGKDAFLDMSEAAEMRPVYKAPSKSNKSVRPTTIAGSNKSSIKGTPVPRRRVVRRPRATQNTPRPTVQ